LADAKPLEIATYSLAKIILPATMGHITYSAETYE